MAETWTAYFSAVTFAAGKNMGTVLNAHASEILKIRRVGLLNAQTAAVTGVLCQLELRRYTGGSFSVAGTAITPVAHDTANANPTTATYAHAGTLAGTSALLRRVFWSSDEAAISTGTLDELETMVPLNIIWDAGYGDSNVQPMTLRQGQMCTVWNTTGAAGLLDTWMEFTKE